MHAAEAAVELDGAAAARDGVAVVRRVQAREEAGQPLRVQLLRERCQLIPRGGRVWPSESRLSELSTALLIAAAACALMAAVLR